MSKAREAAVAAVRALAAQFRDEHATQPGPEAVVDAVVSALAAAVPQDVAGREKLCRERAMEQWEASLKRPDLSERDRVSGAIAAYERQALACDALLALSAKGAGETVAWRWRAKVNGEWGLWSVVDVDPNDWTWREYWEDMQIVPLAAASSPATTVPAGVEVPFDEQFFDPPAPGEWEAALEAAKVIVAEFNRQDDPGVSDLYDEQPFHITVPLGVLRKLRRSLPRPTNGGGQ